jgi:hypothetical protein
MPQKGSVQVGGYRRKANTVDPYRRSKPDKKGRK